MSAKSLALILHELNGLTDEEKRTLAGRLSILSSDRGVDGEVYSVVVRIVGAGFPPLAVLRKSKQFIRFKNGAETLVSFVKENFGQMRKASRLRIMLLLAQCVVDDLKSQGLRLSPLVIGARLSCIWSVVEEYYPGYMEAGCLAEALGEGRDKRWKDKSNTTR
jgi:hypothetical protein